METKTSFLLDCNADRQKCAAVSLIAYLVTMLIGACIAKDMTMPVPNNRFVNISLMLAASVLIAAAVFSIQERANRELEAMCIREHVSRPRFVFFSMLPVSAIALLSAVILAVTHGTVFWIVWMAVSCAKAAAAGNFIACWKVIRSGRGYVSHDGFCFSVYGDNEPANDRRKGP